MICNTRGMATRYFTMLGQGAVVTGVVLLVLQLVPYGREHTNPPVAAEPAWDQPATRALTARACFDCHSNETRWPWYSSVAPLSWFVQSHVDTGRRVLNFSEWQRGYEEAREAAESVREGEMPLTSYLLLHAEARLSASEQRQLIRGLEATLGVEGGEGEEEASLRPRSPSPVPR